MECSTLKSRHGVPQGKNLSVAEGANLIGLTQIFENRLFNIGQTVPSSSHRISSFLTFYPDQFLVLIKEGFLLTNET